MKNYIKNFKNFDKVVLLFKQIKLLNIYANFKKLVRFRIVK